MTRARVAVVGAGAVGSFFGAKLAGAGHDVHLVGRAPHVESVRARGLVLESGGEHRTVRVSAGADPDGVAGADLVLVAVKAGDTAETGRALAPHLAADATVLSLQNGADTAARLGSATGRPVVPAAVYVAVEMAGPGHVRHHGRGELAIGSGPESAALADLFRSAGVPAEVSDNVSGILWAKLIVNCAYNGLSAVSRLPYGRMVAVEGVNATMADIVDECLAVAAATGVRVEGDVRAAVAALASTMPDQFSSTAQDIARGRRTEIDHLNGFVVQAAERAGLRAPANRAVWTAVKLLEAGPRAA